MKKTRYALFMGVLFFGAIALSTTASADADKPSVARATNPKLAAMGFKVPQKESVIGCRAAYSGCLKGCTGEDVNGCIMGCETDCSVCILDATGTVSESSCDGR